MNVFAYQLLATDLLTELSLGSWVAKQLFTQHCVTTGYLGPLAKVLDQHIGLEIIVYTAGYLVSLSLAKLLDQHFPHYWGGKCLRVLSVMVCWQTSQLLPCLEFVTRWPPGSNKSSHSTDSTDSLGYDGFGFRSSEQSLSTDFVVVSSWCRLFFQQKLFRR